MAHDGAGFEICIAEAASTALCNQQTLAVPGHLADQFTGLRITDDRAQRDIDLQIFSRLPEPFPASAALPALCPVQPFESEIRKRIKTVFRDQKDTATITSITPSGPPFGRYFSLRKLKQPLPPLPAMTLIVASSTNFMVAATG